MKAFSPPTLFSAVARRRSFAFSLVEMLAAVAIIGVISFLAIPNLIQVRQDSERNMAVARCEAINMAMATYIQATGRTQAVSNFNAASTAQLKYALISPYLAFSEANLTDFVPNGYTVTFNTIDPIVKVTLTQSGTVIPY